MKLTQRETDALLRAWRGQLSQQQSPVAQARLTAILRDLQDHDPAAVRRWLIDGGDLESHFDGTAQTAKSVAKVFATELTDVDPLDQTVAAPFYIDTGAPVPSRDPAPDMPRSAPLRPATQLHAPTQAQPQSEPWLGAEDGQLNSETLRVEREATARHWQARTQQRDHDTLTHTGWRKLGALACGALGFGLQTALLVAVGSAAFAWQTGTEISREWFIFGAATSAAIAFLWMAQRTVRRFRTINAKTSLPLTDVRALKLVLVPLCIGVALTAISEFGRPLLANNGLNTGNLTLAVLALGLIANTLYFHSVPVIRTITERTPARWWHGV